MKKMRMAALKIQCMYRCWKSRKVVRKEKTAVRDFADIDAFTFNLQSYPSNMKILVPDKKGRLTHSRSPADEEELKVSKVKPIVDLTKLNEEQRLDLEDALSNLQGHFRYLAKIKGIRRIQALARGQRDRKKLAKMQQNSKAIQAWVRARIVRKQVRLMRANIELIQANARRHLAQKNVQVEKPLKELSADAQPVEEVPAETPAEKPAEQKPAEEEKPEEQQAAEAPAETAAEEQ